MPELFKQEAADLAEDAHRLLLELDASVPGAAAINAECRPPIDMLETATAVEVVVAVEDLANLGEPLDEPGSAGATVASNAVAVLSCSSNSYRGQTLDASSSVAGESIHPVGLTIRFVMGRTGCINITRSAGRVGAAVALCRVGHAGESHDRSVSRAPFSRRARGPARPANRLAPATAC